MASRVEEQIEQLRAVAVAAAHPHKLVDILTSGSREEVIPRIAELCGCTEVGAMGVLNMQVDVFMSGRAERYLRAAEDLERHEGMPRPQ